MCADHVGGPGRGRPSDSGPAVALSPSGEPASGRAGLVSGCTGVPAPLPSLHHQGDRDSDDGNATDHGDRPQTDRRKDVLEGDADHESEQGVADAPDQSTAGVVEEEHAVAEAAHSGQGGNDRPGKGHEPTEEDGRTPVPLEHGHGPSDPGSALERTPLEEPRS